MAIYPDTFPEERKNEKAEELVFGKMRMLPDYFDVFYNNKFSGREIDERNDYEIDFIVTDLRNNRFNGIVCIEVKGGILKCVGNDEWYQNAKKIKSPTGQALSGLKNLVKKRYPWLNERVYSDWMVCFPDSGDLSNDTLPESLSEHRLIGYEKLNWLKETLVDHFDRLRMESPHKRGLSQFEYDSNFKSNLIKEHGFVLTISTRIRADESAFVKMTARQSEIVRAAMANPKLLIKGLAGSGKTVIAKEIAQERFEKGLNVLFLCYNRILANNIQSYFSLRKQLRVEGVLEEVDPEMERQDWTGLAKVIDRHKNTMAFSAVDGKAIRVQGYHSFAYSVIESAEAGWWIKNISKEDSFWDEKVPDKILELLIEGKIKPVFDVIIIDEGQDFAEEWIETIIYFLKPEGNFYVFKDEFQNIYQKPSRIAKGPNETSLRIPIVYLDKNCRNTRQIAAKLSAIIEIDINSMEGVPEGADVEIVRYKNDTEQQTKIISLLKKLINSENQISPDRILILLNTSFGDSCLGQVRKVDNLPLKIVNDRGELSKNAVNYTNIKYFKGLEADIVLVIDLDPDKFIYDKEVLYAQASRAKHMLYIFEKTERLNR